MHIYQGVPHTFAEFPELETTKQFNADMLAAMKDLAAWRTVNKEMKREGKEKGQKM